MKKLITLGLALVLVLSLFTTTFAAKGIIIDPVAGGRGGGFQTQSGPPRIVGD